ncbi:unnamed protein product [Cunninghamella echinulata]
MDSLPNEIIQNIFTFLPQKYAATVGSTVCKAWYQFLFQPSFYSTIHIYTKQQLKKCIQMAKEKTIHTKPIGHYIQHLIFHFYCKLDIEDLLEITKIVPNIHSINGSMIIFPMEILPIFNDIPKNNNFPQLQQLTHFEEWYTIFNNTWMTTLLNNKDIVESIDVEYTQEMMNYNKIKQPPPPIHFKPFGQSSSTSLPPYAFSNRYRLAPPQRMILILQSFKQLTHLNFCCPIFSSNTDISLIYFDEYTLESIHQSCPHIVSLSLVQFNMSISEEGIDTDTDTDITYEKTITTSAFQHAHHLKELKIQGKIIDPKCYTYFSKKYPQLESLTFCLQIMPIPKDTIKPYQLAIHNMITKFQLLKKLNITLWYEEDEMIELTHNSTEGNEVWPNNEFIQWLLQNPTQLTHFTYDNDGLKELSYMIGTSIDQQQQLVMDDHQYMISKIVLQHTLFNHLIYLSLTSKLSQTVMYHHLLQNENTIVLSFSIKELVIQGCYGGERELIYITDWLDVLPNLTILKMSNSRIIINENDILQTSNKNYDVYAHKSHKWIKQRMKQQQQQQQQQIVLSNGNDDGNNNSIYKLKSLTLNYATLHMKKGLNDFLRKCPHIKRLELCGSRHLFPEQDSVYDSSSLLVSSTAPSLTKEIHFDLSQHHLEWFYLHQLSYYSSNINETHNTNKVTKLIIHETIPNNEQVIIFPDENATTNRSHKLFTLSLKCKYIDELVFN